MTPAPIACRRLLLRAVRAGGAVLWAVCMAGPMIAQPLRIMAVGDSITRGTNDINYPNGDIPGGYRRKLGELLTANGVTFDFVGERSDNAAPGMDPHHNGNNGWRTDQMLAPLSAWLAASPDRVLLMAGTNDILQGVPVAVAAQHLESLIIQTTSTLPECRLIVATILPVTQDWNGQAAATLNANAEAYNAEVRARVAAHAAAGRKVSLADMNALIVIDDPDPLLDFYQPGDGIHPGQAGYDQLGSLWFGALQALGFAVDTPAAGRPAAPSALAADAVSPSRVNLSWTDNAGNEALHRVWRRRLDSGPWESVAQLPANTTSHALTGMSNGLHGHAFAVEAVNAAGTSAWSNVAVIAEHDEKAHLRTASASSFFQNQAQFAPPKANDGQLTTRWASGSSTGDHFWQVDLNEAHHIEQVVVTTSQTTDVADHRRNFEVRASNDPTFATYSVLGTQGTTALPHKGALTLNVSHPRPFRHVRVAKTDSSSFSITLVQVHGIDAVPAPLPPVNVTAETLDSSHVRLSWSPVSQNEKEFDIQRAPASGGTFVSVAKAGGTATVHVDAGLPAATAFRYRIVAMNETGNSAPSAEAGATTAGAPAYQLWLDDHPALPSDMRDPADDPDGDGLVNLLEHAFGTDPAGAAGHGALPRLRDDASAPGLFLQFTRNRRSPDLLYQVQSSTTLQGGGWTPHPPAGALIEPHPHHSGLETVTLPILPAAGEDRRFFRLLVRDDAATE